MRFILAFLMANTYLGSLPADHRKTMSTDSVCTEYSLANCRYLSFCIYIVDRL
jgi:hypothetical protein